MLSSSHNKINLLLKSLVAMLGKEAKQNTIPASTELLVFIFCSLFCGVCLKFVYSVSVLSLGDGHKGRKKQ